MDFAGKAFLKLLSQGSWIKGDPFSLRPADLTGILNQAI
jgi:hypothetical protein